MATSRDTGKRNSSIRGRPAASPLTIFLTAVGPTLSLFFIFYSMGRIVSCRVDSRARVHCPFEFRGHRASRIEVHGHRASRIGVLRSMHYLVLDLLLLGTSFCYFKYDRLRRRCMSTG